VYRLYKLTTVLEFGKYKDYEIQEVLKEEPWYIEWCVSNIPEFIIDSELIRTFKNFHPLYKLNKDFIQKLDDKFENFTDWEEQWMDAQIDFEADKFYRDSYGDAFENDPENYWNVD